MKKFWLLLSILFIWTCGGGGGSKAPTEPVEPAPVSNFTATPTSGLQPLEVVFTSTATGTITSYAWNVDADTDIEGTAATFTHTYSDAGTYSVTLTVTGPGGSNPKTVADMITVSTAAPTPTTSTSQTMQEDGSTTISLTATDPNGQAVTFAITTDPSNGTATLSGTEITYTPNANFYGTDSVAYTASNGTYTSDPVTITITVEGEDDEPTTNDVSATTDEDTVVTVNLDATEIDGDNYSFSIVTQPTNGTLGSVSGNQVEYTPNQDFNGTDTFTFEATDDRTSRRNVATATITVNAVNDAPVANDVTASMDENKIAGRYQPVTITLDATDVDGDALTYSLVSDVSNGTLGSISDNQIIYTPTQDFNGTDTFTYKANDGTDDSNTATVTITINSVNDAPVTQNQGASTNEDTAITITLSVVDVDTIQGMTRSIVSNPSNGSVVLTGSGSQIATYTPNANWNGTDTFTWKANDGTVDSNTSTVTITVASVNDAPLANDVTASTTSRTGNMRQSVDITLSVTDADGDDLTYSLVSDVSNGTTSLSGNVVTYTPTANYDGEDTFTYKANDGTVDSNTATGTITITDTNQAPIASDITKTILEGSGLTLNLQGSDVDNDSITFSIVTSPQHGSLNAVGSGEYIYALSDNDFIGTDTFTYKVNDGSLNSNAATVTINVINPFKMFSGSFNDIIHSSDDNFVAISQGKFTKMDSNLDTIWSLSFPTSGGDSVCRLIEASDGSFVGGCSDRIVKVSSSGSLIWNVQTQGKQSDVVETSDGGFVASGRIDSQGLTSAKVDNSGNIIWNLLYSFTNDGGPGPRSQASIIQSSNNTFIIGQSGRLLKISGSDGSSIWYKNRSSSNINYDIVDMVKIGSNGDFLTYITDSSFPGALHRYNTDGELVYASSGLDFYNISFGDYAQNGDNFYAAGKNSGFEFVKIDPSDGSIIWTKEIECYGYPPSPGGFWKNHAIVEDASGNINFFFNPGNNLGSGDINSAFFQIDPDGNVLIP